MLGLLLAPSWPGLLLGGVALLVLLARTPAELGPVDVQRGPVLERNRVTAWEGLVEVLLLMGLGVGAVLVAGGPLWVPFVFAGLLVCVELMYGIGARDRGLVADLALAIRVAAVAALVLLADGCRLGVALGAWAILAGGAITWIPYMRDQLRQLHGRPGNPRTLLWWDVAALSVVTATAALAPALAGGALAVGVVVVLQRVSALAPVRTTVMLGVPQSIAGIAVVLATWAGVVVHGGLP